MARDDRGERNGRSRLTEADVLEIRRLWAETNLRGREIGEMFGVTRQMVSRIVLRQSWTHI